MVKIEKVAYFNQPNCYKLSNEIAEVIVTTDIGPRVIAYRFIGDENILNELGPDAVVKTDLGDWHPWGGHRFWHAPEAMPRSYVPADSPIKYDIVGDDSIRLMRPEEEATHIQKEILVTLAKDGTNVKLTHKLYNLGIWPVKMAPWALTIVNSGGVTIIPNEPYISHDDYLLPARPMVLWHFTNMSDPRWTFGRKFVQLRTDESLSEPQKVGVGNKQGWAAYLRKNTLFVKRFPYIEGSEYPDLGCNCETYTEGGFMEVESLGPLELVEPGASIEYIENWYLFKGVDAGKTEDDLEAAIMPLVKSTG